MEWLGVSRMMSSEMGKVSFWRNYPIALFILLFNGHRSASELPSEIHWLWKILAHSWPDSARLVTQWPPSLTRAWPVSCLINSCSLMDTGHGLLSNSWPDTPCSSWKRSMTPPTFKRPWAQFLLMRVPRRASAHWQGACGASQYLPTFSRESWS